MRQRRPLGAATGFGTSNKPFSAQSPWNCRPNAFTLGAYQIPTTLYDAYIGGGPYSVTGFIASISDPPVTLYGVNGPGTNSLHDLDAETYDDFRIIPHFPPNLIGAVGADGHADIIDRSLGIIHSLYQVRLSGGIYTASEYAWTDLKGRGWGDGGHYFQGARATGVPTIGGVIRFRELDDSKPYFLHALAMSLDYSGLSHTVGYVFPATSCDYDAPAANNGQIPEGALLMLPVDFPEFPGSDLSTTRLNKVVRTLKRYGGYVVDRNNDTRFVIYVEGVTSEAIYTSGYDPVIAAKMNVISAALRVATPTSFFDGNGAPLSALDRKVNMLSMRGPYTLNSGTTLGKYDTLKQAVVFAEDSTPTSQVSVDGGPSLHPITWLPPAHGASTTVRCKATGGASAQVLLHTGSNLYGSPRLYDGESATFSWPNADGVDARITSYSGPSGGGEVGITMMED